MMKFRWHNNPTILWILIGVTTLSVGAAANDSASEIVTEILSDIREQTAVPAYSVAIVRDGQLVISSTVGEIDTENHIGAKPEHLFRLASVSKLMGATMLALLVQQGALDPEAPISDYLADLPEQYRDLTTLQLLTHTSGMPHYQARDALRGQTHYASAIEALASVGDRALLSTPGSSYLYSSHGYTILSALHETVSGDRLVESVPEFVESLSGRSSPALENHQRQDSLQSKLFDVGANGSTTLQPRDQSFSPFGTGFVSTAVDLAHFGDAVLHSPRIDPETRSLLFRPVRLSNGEKTGDYLYEVAFGWRVGKDTAGRTVYHHAGATQGARSVLILYPEYGLSVVFLSNAAWTAGIERTGFALASITLEDQSRVMFDGQRDFTGSFDGREISGALQCDKGSCRFSDRQGALTEWLVRYSPHKEVQLDWPVVLVDGEGGPALLIATTVGIVELQRLIDPSKADIFQAEISNGRKLVVQFSD